MTISFSNIPVNERVPLFYAEMDNSQANSAQANQGSLLIAQQLSTATATAGLPVLVSGEKQVASICGYGSMAHRMAQAYFNNDDAGLVYLLPLADPAGVAATGTLTFTAVPTETGVVSFYIGGRRVQISVGATDTVTTIAAALVVAINADPYMEVTATSAVGVVTITAKHKGSCGNSIDLRMNYLGTAGGEITPKGLTYTIVAMASGTLVPDIATPLSNLTDQNYDFIVTPFTDTVSLASLKSFLSDSTGRWSSIQELFGHYMGAYVGTYGTITTFGTGMNDQHGSIFGLYDCPETPWNWAAACFGAAAVSLRNDPGLPLQTVTVQGVLPPPQASRFDKTERNNLLHAGISTYSVGSDSTVMLENVITTYQTNKYGVADNSYLEIETMFLLMFVTRFMQSAITSKYARMKLAADGTRFAPGSSIVTPSMIRAELIAQYKTLEFNGYVQGADVFAKNVIVQINASNPNRVDVLWPGILIDQLRIFALKNQFRLTA